MELTINTHEALQSARMSYGARVQVNRRYIEGLSQASLDARRAGNETAAGLFRQAITDMSESVERSHATARQALEEMK